LELDKLTDIERRSMVPYFREPVKRHKEWEKNFYRTGEENA
jgi:hypothetical protein